MNYRRVDPAPDLSEIIQYLWMVDDDSDIIERREQKIIPDGYPEVIFHFGDPYRIRLGRQWQMQSPCLIAGQIKKHFFLANTGRSNILGVKVKPSALTHLFDIRMNELTDRVLDINRRKSLADLATLYKKLLPEHPVRRCTLVEDFFRSRVHVIPQDHPVDKAVDYIFKCNGMTGVSEVASLIGFSERHLEQLFKRFVGLTPKFFARVVRFSYIFQLINDGKPDWSDVVFRAGYYDQSHFIRNFKAFTGEDPSKYRFSKKDLANFFLNKKTQTA